MAAARLALPDCGLYRTTQALPAHEDDVPAGILVYFHNHSDSGLPQIVLPDHNVHNRWHFHGPGVTFRSLAWAASLGKLPPQGFYFLKDEILFDGGSWPKFTLTQLGYTRRAEPILFIAQEQHDPKENSLYFSEKGVKIDLELLSLLEPLVVYRDPSADPHASDPA